MPYLSHYRLTCTGTLGAGGGREAFAWGISLAKGNSDGTNQGNGTADGIGQPDNDQFDNLVADCVAFHTRAATKISPYAALRQVKLAWIGPDGKYTRDPMVADVVHTGGGLFEPVHPPQIALAVSLSSEKRGPRGRGRFYLPMPAVDIDPTTLTISDADRDTIRGSVVTFLQALYDEPNIDVLGLGPTIASSFGTNSAVTGVRVGRTLDTVRSRRRSVVEDYEEPTPVEP